MTITIDVPDRHIKDLLRLHELDVLQEQDRLPEEDEDEYNELFEELGAEIMPLVAEAIRNGRTKDGNHED